MMFKDIIDFNFEHFYYNFSGRIQLKIKSENNSILINRNATNTIFQRKSTSNDILKIQNLYNYLLPFLLEGFIQYAINKINNFNKFTIANIRFTQYGLSMRPRTTYWLKLIEIPYQYADIFSEKLGSNLNHGVYIFLRDNRINESYRYSFNIGNQPSQGEIIKAKELLKYIKKNKLFGLYDPEYLKKLI